MHPPIVVSLEDCLVVLVGDFNTVLDPQLDRSHASKADSIISGCFNSFLRHTNICDVWRLQNDGVKDYTFFSARHKSYSRIDYLLMSPSLIPFISKVNILPLLFSSTYIFNRGIFGLQTQSLEIQHLLITRLYICGLTMQLLERVFADQQRFSL